MNESEAKAQSTDSRSSRRWVLAALPLLVFLVLAAIFMKQLLEGGNTREIPSVLIGKPAPVFDLPQLEGLKNSDGQLPGITKSTLIGKVSVVNVWASWCGPCRVEHPFIMDLARDDRIQVVGLNYKDQNANALRFLAQLGNPFSVVGVDQRGSAAIDWGVYGIPETFIVDAKGIIRYKQIGPLSPKSYEEKFLPALEEAIAGPSS
ncbi:MAG: DsbE family thiol:disulfide interchange protein [Rhizobiaceae bacterium]